MTLHIHLSEDGENQMSRPDLTKPGAAVYRSHAEHKAVKASHRSDLDHDLITALNNTLHSLHRSYTNNQLIHSIYTPNPHLFQHTMYGGAEREPKHRCGEKENFFDI